MQRKLWTLGLLFVVIALTLSASAFAQRADTRLLAGTVHQIDIIASWGGLGPAQYAHTIIRRHGNHFAVDDQPVQIAQVQALVAALVAPPLERLPPDFVSRRISNYDIDYFAGQSLQQCIGVGAALDGVEPFFKHLFYDRKNQSRWIADEYDPQNFHTDDYPSEKVTLTFDDGSTISAFSESYKLFMLPFKVTTNETTYTTFNDQIPQALAALTTGGVNSERLSGGATILSEYGDWLCDAFGSKLQLAALRVWAPQVASFIASRGITLEDLRLGDHFDMFYARLRFPEWPGSVTYQVQVQTKPLSPTSYATVGLATLRDIERRGDLITSLPWVRRWFQTAHKPQMRLESFVGGNNSLDSQSDMAELKAASPTAYAAVERNLRAVVQGMTWEGEQKQGTPWLFLPNGNAVELDDHGKIVDPQGRTVNP